MGVVEEHARRVRGGYKAGCRYGMVVDVGGVVVGLVAENGLGGWDGRGLHLSIETEREHLGDEEGVETLLPLCFGCRDSRTSLRFFIPRVVDVGYSRISIHPTSINAAPHPFKGDFT
jgi:hypothetical protein